MSSLNWNVFGGNLKTVKRFQHFVLVIINICCTNESLNDSPAQMDLLRATVWILYIKHCWSQPNRWHKLYLSHIYNCCIYEECVLHMCFLFPLCIYELKILVCILKASNYTCLCLFNLSLFFSRSRALAISYRALRSSGLVSDGYVLSG